MHSSPHLATIPRNTHSRLLTLPILHILVLVAVGLICYANTLHVPMLLDDEGSIQLHTPVHGLANYFAEGWPGYNYLPNRAFGYLTFALNYEFGGLSLPGYHLVNLAIHITSGLLVYVLIRLTFRTPYMHNAGFSQARANIFAFVVALFFICHPIQTQSVTYIIQRLTSMTAMFYLATLVCYVRWRLLPDGTKFSAYRSVFWYLSALLCTVLAMKTKETSFTLPVMLLFYECTFFGAPGRKLLIKMAPLLLTILLIPLTTYFKVAPLIESTGGGGSILADTNTPAYNVVRVTRMEYLYTQLSVIITYLRLMFFPVNQHLDYDYPINHSLFEPRSITSLLLILAILLSAVRMFLKSSRNPAIPPAGSASPLLRLAAFGIFWFFITLSVESSIIVLLDVIYEHRLYLPSLGFFLSLAALGTIGAQRLECKYVHTRKVLFAAVAGIAAIFSVATYSRNNVWRDWITLWSDNVAKSPNKPRPHNILGIGYFYSKRFDESMVEYKEAVRLKPDFIEAYYNMALIHGARKEHQDAIKMYLKVLALSAYDPIKHALAYNEIGIHYAEVGNNDQAATAFASAVKYDPESAEYRNNYAYALSTSGHVDEAIQQYREALRLDPENSYAIKALQEITSTANPDGR